MLQPILPRIAETYQGARVSLWLLGAFIALSLLMSVNRLINARKIMTGADGTPLDTMLAYPAGPSGAGQWDY